METGRHDVENPLPAAASSDDFPVIPDVEDDEDVEIIGRNSIADLAEIIPHYRKPTKSNPKTLADNYHSARKRFIKALEYRDLKWYTKLFLVSLILPTAVFCLLKQLRMFVVLAVFNYSGFNLRPYLFFDMATERDIMRDEEKYRGGPFTLSKVFYVAQRYMTYWIVIVMLLVATPFVNQITMLDVMNRYKIFENDPTLNYLLQVVISVLIGFANLIPSSPVRSDISSFVSSFTEEDYTFRDCCHTRLKSLTEILEDIKQLGFVLLHSDIGSPIIVSTQSPEDIRRNSGFIALLSTDTFENNQILRFIQIEEDVDSFFVLRNDIGMCTRVEIDPFEWETLASDLKAFKIRLEISEMELNVYGGLSLVMLVGLFAAQSHMRVAIILTAWVVLPILLAVKYRRRKSKLASINFFTLDGKDRKYQPFNNVCVSTDDIIMERIYAFRFFKALFKFTMQGRYLVHTLLKATENVDYEWLKTGLKMKDFKRLACLAAIVYERDVAVITPHAKVYYCAPRTHHELCVVCIMHANGEITSQQMKRRQFEAVSQGLKEGRDTHSLENMYFK